MTKKKLPISFLLPGYILCEVYVPEGPFTPARETEGIDQMSRVLLVGDPVHDSNNVLRTTPVKEGHIIHHAYSNKVIDIDFKQYRYVHFTEVHAIV